MSRNLTSKPWWGLGAMRERVAALRAEMEPELASKRVEVVERHAIGREPADRPWHPQRGTGGGNHKRKLKKK